MPVRYEQDGRIVTITIDRPEALNSINPEINQGLSEAFNRFRADDEAWIAILTGAGGTQRLPRAIGMSAALEIILTGRQVGAEEALRLGLVHRVVPHGEVMAEARKTAEALLANGPLALRAAKRAVVQGWDMPL